MIHLINLGFASSPLVIKTDSEIKEVTVYTNGALITRELTNGTNTGLTELHISGLPKTILESSIVIEADESLEIISINSSLESIGQQSSTYLDSLTSINKTQRDSLSELKKLYEVLVIERKLLEDHNNYSDELGRTDINAVIKASEFYRTRLKQILLEQLSIEKMIAEKQMIIEANNSLSKEFNDQQSVKETSVRIKLNALRTNGKIALKYYLPNARWYTYYDIKVNDLDKPMTLLRKAYVMQKTGEDWNKVKLTLSNANPNESNSLPPLNPYRIDGPRAYRHQKSSHHSHSNYSSEALVYGVVLDEQGMPMIGANVIIAGTDQGTITDIDGRFEFNAGANQFATVSYTGYDTKRIYLRAGMNLITLSEGQLLDEVVVTGLGKNSRKKYAKKAAQAERREIQQVKVDAISSVEYHIKNPYSIASDNQEIDVLLETLSVPCSYIYKAHPYKSEKAFLMSYIADWHRLDLLAGNANLFLSNTYKGKTYISPDSDKDTLNISLGYDPEIIIKRTEVKDKYSKRFLSKNVQEELTYDISIKNNKTQTVTLEITDQIPVSDNKEIKIELLEKSEAEVDKEKGFLSWKVKLPEGGRSIKRFSYKVKYPKNYKVLL